MLLSQTEVFVPDTNRKTTRWFKPGGGEMFKAAFAAGAAVLVPYPHGKAALVFFAVMYLMDSVAKVVASPEEWREDSTTEEAADVVQ